LDGGTYLRFGIRGFWEIDSFTMIRYRDPAIYGPYSVGAPVA